MCVCVTGVRLIKANGGEVMIQIQRGDARATLQSQSSFSQSQEEGAQWECFNICDKCSRIGWTMEYGPLNLNKNQMQFVSSSDSVKTGLKGKKVDNEQ